MSKSFPFVERRKKKTAKPTEAFERAVWIMLRLFDVRYVTYAAYCDHFGANRRSFQRDLQKIREVSKGLFTVSKAQQGKVVLEGAIPRFSPCTTTQSRANALLTRLAASLGGPLGEELNGAIQSTAVGDDEFLYVSEPLPASEGHLREVFSRLREAARGPAIVEFTYHSQGASAVRRVEPYHVSVRDGRYYLTAYDLGRKGWRYFALDAIDLKSYRKTGTFRKRSVPPQRMPKRALGWMSGIQEQEVTIWLSSRIVSAVSAERWQPEQSIRRNEDGSAHLTVISANLREIVRWSLRFAPEAVIISPPSAVQLAWEVLTETAQRYSTERGLLDEAV